VQRVAASSVEVAGERVGGTAPGPGLVVLAGLKRGDGEADVAWMARKVAGLRVFDDASGVMNLSALDVGAGVLAVSQFTLYGDCRGGRRPSYSAAMPPGEARPLFGLFLERLREQGLRVESGVFQAEMLVRIDNDGPVTLLLDSEKNF
jgi:D-tyrosyl-tRNA(Tyr) deacylase